MRLSDKLKPLYFRYHNAYVYEIWQGDELPGKAPSEWSSYHCGKQAAWVSVCHVILQDHMTKGSSSFMGGTSSYTVTTPG